MAKSTEREIALGVCKYLSTLPDGVATLRSIRRNLPIFIPLSAEDRAPSSTRKGEEMWEQQVRNIISHRKSQGNFIHDGYLDRMPYRLSLTESGRAII